MKKGLDAPLVPILFVGFGLLGIIATLMSNNKLNAIYPLILLLFGVLYLHTSLIGKYKIIQKIVGQTNIPKNAQVLDLGTGHGAFLVEIAKKLKTPGRVTGIDIWNKNDQSSNSVKNTQKIIDSQGLTDVSRLVTADMTKLPFEDKSFDLVVASISIHNVNPTSNRKMAIHEAYRVLKPGGEIIIMDIEHVSQYRKILEELDVAELTIKNAGVNSMYGLLFTKVLKAKKR